MTHGQDICPLYGDIVLLGERGECTLCGAMPNSTSIICAICHDQGKRRASYPIDTKFKSNINEHVKIHQLKGVK